MGSYAESLLDLSGRRFLITGAASGIGKATALMLHKLGADLILVDVNPEGLDALKSALKPTDYFLPLDLADAESIKPALVRAVSATGKLHGLAHVAGIPYICPLKMVNAAKCEKVYKVNTYAAIELAKVCSNKRICADERVSFVLISSVYGLVGSAANVGYAMSKAGIIGVTKALSMELVAKNIRVNCVAPGFIISNMMGENSFRFDKDYMTTLNNLHPMGLGKPEDIAKGIVFLLSDMSSWMTGAVLNIDGGFTAQ